MKRAHTHDKHNEAELWYKLEGVDALEGVELGDNGGIPCHIHGVQTLVRTQ